MIATDLMFSHLHLKEHHSTLKSKQRPVHQWTTTAFGYLKMKGLKLNKMFTGQFIESGM